MTFRRGMKRLALFLGALGAIVGGVAAYIATGSLITQKSHHQKFEQLVSTNAVQKERKLLKWLQSAPVDANGFSIGDVPLNTTGSAPPDTQFFPNPDYRPPTAQGSEPSELALSGIAEVHWTQDNEVEYIKGTDGQCYFAGSAPRWWQYFLTLTLPIVGFFIPWGLVTALVWVCSGFIEPQA